MISWIKLGIYQNSYSICCSEERYENEHFKQLTHLQRMYLLIYFVFLYLFGFCYVLFFFDFVSGIYLSPPFKCIIFPLDSVFQFSFSGELSKHIQAVITYQWKIFNKIDFYFPLNVEGKKTQRKMQNWIVVNEWIFDKYNWSPTDH